MEVKSRVKKGYHCAWQIHYHIVFPVKYRKALLDADVIRIIKETSLVIEERYDIEFEALGMDKDHIHILCGGHPKISPGQIVRIFKSITAREIFKQKPSIKKELRGGEFWTDGYFASTVGKHGNEDTVLSYVKKQGKEYRKIYEDRQLALF
ncbi:IS200/IS605 family transposase [Candidatus Magnetomonas plexicatena]|uniref:IS200/IS605 family transposase n=1 Tax=Candidatus Magnetomonas plexicatena TaxID=2552947 RepID=UPI001C7816C7|nr:IS200/IS605 family transposase [Nitrospirales bacterium LBB_01]